MRAWTGNPRLFGSLGVYVTLPDGSYLPVAVRVASAHLVANVQLTGQLWVKGQPEAGGRAVGAVGHASLHSHVVRTSAGR